MTSYIENVSANDIRNVTGLSSSDVSDAQLTSILSGVVAQLNADILIRYDDWRVVPIDAWRENKVDSFNTTFYLPDDKRIVGDRNGDGKIDANDVVAYTVSPSTSPSAVKTAITVSSISDDEYGKIVLASAPGNSDALFLSWASSPIDMETPHPLIKRALILLAASVAYTRIDVGRVSKFRVGKVSVMQQSEGFKKYMDDYKQVVFQIKSRAVKRKDHDSIIAHGGFRPSEITIEPRSYPRGDFIGNYSRGDWR